MNNRAGVVIMKDNAILLLHRIKNNQEYYCIPGGHVESGESFEEAAVREIFEETTLRVTLKKLLITLDNQGRKEQYFLADTFTGIARLSGPEAIRNSKKNSYQLVWVDSQKIKDLLLYPTALKAIL